MAEKRRDDAPAEHPDASDDADNADLDPANVTGLLRIGAVEKTPGKRRQEDGQDPGLGHAFDKRYRKQAKQELFAGGGHEPDGYSGDPRERGVDRIGVVQTLRRPNSITPAHQIEGNEEPDV